MGRDYNEIVKTYNAEVVAVAKTEDEAKRIVAASPYVNHVIAGTPRQVADQFQAFVELGVTRFAIRCVDFPRMDGLELFIDEVLPLMK